MKYRLEYTSRARKDLHKLNRETAQRVVGALHMLRDDPYSHIKKLKCTTPGHPVYTFRIGLYYRAIISLHDSLLVIHVLEVEARSRAYRDF